MTKTATSGRSDTSAHKCLLVLFRRQVTLSLIDDWPGAEITVDGETYRDVGSGDWTGYYDWLRNTQGAILGVRYWPSEETHFLVSTASPLSYSRVYDNERQPWVEIYFSDDRNVDYERSKDYDFVYSRVLSSDLAEYAICFDTGSLTSDELESIALGAKADWRTKVVNHAGDDPAVE